MFIKWTFENLLISLEHKLTFEPSENKLVIIKEIQYVSNFAKYSVLFAM